MDRLEQESTDDVNFLQQKLLKPESIDVDAVASDDGEEIEAIRALSQPQHHGKSWEKLLDHQVGRFTFLVEASDDDRRFFLLPSDLFMLPPVLIQLE
ncbi:hypothetical protein BHE74_00037439 [Ensete ventricosum]|nr:hypothetical protein GW17_00037124 [Ensete ventricosum]RWW55882.1 hypothetical protein BHE74_00037439 [Ensete ventricosum]